MRKFWKDYFELWKKGWEFLKEHWLGYTILCVVGGVCGYVGGFAIGKHLEKKSIAKNVVDFEDEDKEEDFE